MKLVETGTLLMKDGLAWGYPWPETGEEHGPKGWHNPVYATLRDLEGDEGIEEFLGVQDLPEDYEGGKLVKVTRTIIVEVDPEQ